MKELHAILRKFFHINYNSSNNLQPGIPAHFKSNIFYTLLLLCISTSITYTSHETSQFNKCAIYFLLENHKKVNFD